ncbi:putative sulfurtransferase [Rubidibacter lacunae KORDI 51-2]|uniref:tRNA uridine(34) hydroxylase n=1 Tax=Rubidibacter lacunae KORDI 51-2 TaxID=582515 RepID=U5DIS7_9CHRO|nr:rhodanese-related sulfurtransferase [Rubidibacter lacunae]ERN41571.1 putative sulfurtransferase [Rubidibacter lacunae KORDI 51-2]
MTAIDPGKDTPHPANASKRARGNIVIAAFYKFVRLSGCDEVRSRLLDFCKLQQLKGTILLASEGINGTVAGSSEAIAGLQEFLQTDERFAEIAFKLSYADETPFRRLYVRVRAEIVTLGLSDVDPLQLTGTRVAPEEWNTLLDDPETLAIDTRNQFEYEVGTFAGAISPQTDAFHEFPQFVRDRLDPQKHRKIAMFCTGGIRCEKASAYLLQQGFAAVYQLDGGILRYLEVTEPEQSRWDGECFVFDTRVSVDCDLNPGSYEQCFACRRPLSDAERQSDKYQPGLACPHCYDELTPEQRASFLERRRQVELAAQRDRDHVGADMSERKAEKQQQKASERQR